jgi:GMP synthase (glutamine-hydrolysing)
MKSVTAIRHVHFEHLGTLEPLLRARGWTVDYLEAGGGGLPRVDPMRPDLLVVLGGPISVYDEQKYPFIREELALLEKRLAADRPTLGICLGAQLMARALGARVYAGPVREIGWSPLILTAAGRSSPVRHLDGATTSMMHWHGDTFDLPRGARLLASTAAVPHQIFALGRHGLAIQCHPELEPGELEDWLFGHAHELAQASIDPARLRVDTLHHGARLVKAAGLCFAEWLAGIEPALSQQSSHA